VARGRRRTWALIGIAGLSYLAVSTILWGEAWADGASTHTLCGCGDPALFLWFFQWPATAIAHGHNPLYSTALFHPGGINLLAQTSVLGLSIPLVPVTWIWGPVAALNVASTLAPALSAFAMFMVLRRWVRWTPAAYLGGLLYGFSPFVLTSLEFAHLMTAALMLLPPILAVLDDIVVRQQHSPVRSGLLLGFLLFLQFFYSSELLAIIAVVVIVATLAIGAVTLLVNRRALAVRLFHALGSLAIAAVVGGVLLVYPVWFALNGPAHLSGLIWPNINAVGGFIGSQFVAPSYVHGANIYNALGGYQGSALPSATYLGWGLLGVLAAGLLIWIRDRRVVFFGLLLAFCMVCSLGERKGQWVPARLFNRIPVLENVIEQRFMAIGFLAAAVMLALVLDRMHADLPKFLKLMGKGGKALGVGASMAVAAVALVPIATTFAPALPFAERPLVVPSWYLKVAPTLPPNRVLLSYPVAFSGIQTAMAWQAIDTDHYAQVGGGGPQGTAARAGAARPGFTALGYLAFGISNPPPTTKLATLNDVRHSMSIWGVNTVVIAPEGNAPLLQQGHDPVYAAGFMTAVIGKLPVIEDGAWVWNNVSLASTQPLHLKPSILQTCVGIAERPVHGHRFHFGEPATMKIADCMALGALS
jgi:hypothetical protein